MDENRDIMGDSEEEPLFWFALADTQWNYGRLIPKVKEKALHFLAQDEELQRWQDSGQKLMAWKKTLNTLKEKLESPQPDIGSISVNGDWGMFLRIAFPVITAVKKGLKGNTSLLGRYRKTLGGPVISYRWFSCMTGYFGRFRL